MEMLICKTEADFSYQGPKIHGARGHFSHERHCQTPQKKGESSFARFTKHCNPRPGSMPTSNASEGHILSCATARRKKAPTNVQAPSRPSQGTVWEKLPTWSCATWPLNDPLQAQRHSNWPSKACLCRTDTRLNQTGWFDSEKSAHKQARETRGHHR